MQKDNSHRGFASMSKERQREIAALGGRAAHSKGTAHQFTSQEASAAGKKGGANVFLKLGASHMSNIGRLGGKARGQKVQTKQPDAFDVAVHGMDADDTEQPINAVGAEL